MEVMESPKRPADIWKGPPVLKSEALLLESNCA